MANKMGIVIWMCSLMFLSRTDGSSEDINISKGLFGSKMCAFFCRHISGCSQFLFSDSTCQIYSICVFTENETMCSSSRVRIKVMTMARDIQCCPMCYKIIHSRTLYTTCVAASTEGSMGNGREPLGTTDNGQDERGTRTLAPSQTHDPKAHANFIRACRKGELAQVKRILSESAVNINNFKSWEKPPVMLAARWGQREVVEFLVHKGADLSLVDNLGNNILHCACIGGNVEIVKYLLSQAMLDINGVGFHDKTPLAIAARYKHIDVVELLVKEGADVTRVDDFGNNVLHCACIGGHVKTVKYVLSRGLTDINARNKIGKTPADLARDRGYTEVCDLLASRGAF